MGFLRRFFKKKPKSLEELRQEDEAQGVKDLTELQERLVEEIGVEPPGPLEAAAQELPILRALTKAKEDDRVARALAISRHEGVTCPYCGQDDLEFEVHYDSVLSKKHVDWYECQGCEVPVEIVDGVVQVEKMVPGIPYDHYSVDWEAQPWA